MNEHEKNFEENGVILLKDVWTSEAMDKVKQEYESLDNSLVRKEIIKDEPIIVFWKHVVGEQKRICTFGEFSTLWDFIKNILTPKLREILPNKTKKLQLLETIIFNKPYEISNTLHWHQDVAYFPLKPNNQVAIWVPLEVVDRQSGALNYALGSHKEGIKGSTDLHTRKPFDNENRDLIPEDPEKAGYKVQCMEMGPTDMVCHSGYTWHYSGPNKKKGFERRGLSVRFIIEDAKFDPRPGQGAAFTKQVDFKAGDAFEGKPFPVFLKLKKIFLNLKSKILKKNFSQSKTPQTSENWKEKSEQERIKIISEELQKNILYKDFEVIKAPDNGQIVLKIERIMPANERGLFLLELEEKLKLAIDQGITVWCEPVGDKSKLRKLSFFKKMNKKNNSVDTKEGALILDSHKLSYHYDRVEAWENGERVAPVCVDMALTRACGAMCSFCYAMVQEPQERATIKTKEALELLDDFAEIGVKAVSLISDGESTLSKAYVPFIQHAAKVGIDVGNATNGWEWEPNKIDQVLPYLTWVRFTVAAGKPEAYAKIMFKSSEHTPVFDRAMKHIKYAVDLKKKLNLKVTLGIQMVLMPEFKDEIIPFAKLALDLGVDYGVIKHCSDDEFGTLGVDYSKYEEMYSLLSEAEKMSNDKTKVIVKWSKIKDKGLPSYNRFYGPQFLLQISGSGLVAPSGMFFNARHSKLHMGNFVDERFIDIFKSDRYWKIMDYLASPSFDAQTMMGTLPIQHYVSEALDNHIKGMARISPQSGANPLHVNFL